MNSTPIIVITGALLAGPLQAGPGNSASYSIPADTTDAAGRRTASASYKNDASAGGIGGISTAAPAETMKHSYIGQLYDPVGLGLTAASLTVNESDTVQLAARLALDDSTFLDVPAGSVTWSVLNGPLTGISAGGLATAAVVYQNTAATAQGIHSGFTGTVGFTVADTVPDNFQTYAADGIADDWQAQYFGVNNPAAGPLLDPDGDTFDNLFEYNARLVPTDPGSFLTIAVNDVAGGGHSVSFSPRFAGSTYTLLGSSDLSLWAPVAGGITDSGDTRTILDPEGTGFRRYYRLDVRRE